MKIPKVSVIIPVYNKEKFLGRCFRSIFCQTMDQDDFEVVVVDDGSQDHSLDILEQYSSQIVLLRHDKNKGLPAALNTGIRAAKGQFIIRIDADDFVHEEYLNIMTLTLLLNPSIDAVACDYVLVDEKNSRVSNVNCIENPIGCAIMYRSEQLIDLGLYDEKFLAHEEKDLKIRFDKKFTLTRMPLPLYRYFIHGENLTSDENLMSRFTLLLDEKHNR